MFVLLLDHSTKGISVLSIHDTKDDALKQLESEKEFLIQSLDSELYKHKINVISSDQLKIEVECSELVAGWLYNSYVKTNYTIDLMICVPKGNYLRQQTKKELSMMDDLKIALEKRREAIKTEE